MDLAAPADQARLPRTKCRFETKNFASCSPPMHLTRAQLTARSRDCRVMLETPRVQILVASTQLISPVSRQAIGFAAGRGVEKTASFAAILSLAIKLVHHVAGLFHRLATPCCSSLPAQPTTIQRRSRHRQRRRLWFPCPRPGRSCANQTIRPMTTQITINDSIDPPLSRELKTGGIRTRMPPAQETAPSCQ